MSDSKRKGAPEDEGDTRASKRARTAGSDETAQMATEKGLKFLENLRSARDKTGRPISTVFEKLPDAKEFPDYYDEIKLPIALETIEKRLKNHEYPSLIAVESDFKRLVQNAKSYNEKNSPIYQDAERVRKTASNWMVRNNPAYKDPNYVAVATPVPGEDTNGTVSTPVAESTPRTRRGTLSAQATKQTPVKGKAADPEPETEPDEPEVADEREGFEGKTFQEAQEKIMDDLINYVDEESGLNIFQPFEWLPPRSLTDYYQIIRYPVSLKSVQKKVRGQVGRGPATGATEFQSWEAFEHEMNFIWDNAWEYNEDDSEISVTAGELKAEFERLLAAAKKAVPEPSKTTLKLNMSQPKPSGLKLRFGPKASPAPSSDPNTPAGRSSATPGVIVDKEALERQQAHVQAGVNGGRPASSGTPGQRPASVNQLNRQSSSATPINTLAGGRPLPVTASPMPNGVKTEAVPSPGLGPGHITNGAISGPSHLGMPGMPPPHLQNWTSSDSPHPSPYGAHPSLHQQPQYIPPPPTPQQFPLIRLPSVAPILPLITLSTHPSLSASSPSHAPISPWKLSIPASSTYTSNSVVVSLPASHHTLQLVPTIPIAKTDKPWRLFVVVNGMRLTQNMRHPQGAASGSNAMGEKDRPVFDVRLPVPVPGGQGGVNRIDVEILAAVKPSEEGRNGKSGASKEKDGTPVKDVKEEVVVRESCTIFVHLLRA